MVLSRTRFTKRFVSLFLCITLISSLFMVLGSINTSAAVAEWTTNTSYTQGTVVSYQGNLYECVIGHTSQVGWEPDKPTSLWKTYIGGNTPTTQPTVTNTPVPSVSPSSSVTPGKVKWGGVRESAYGVSEAGISPFPNGAGWAKAMNSMASRWPGATPAAIWLVGEVDYGSQGTTLQFSSPGGTYDSKISFDANQYAGVNHETCLSYFDTHGIKVWLQIEPGFASVTDQINAVLKKFGSHPSVLGLAIDVEWYKKASDNGDNDYVSDSLAQQWESLVKSYNNNFTLVLKHFDPQYLPPTYRGSIIFCCDDESNGNLQTFLAEHKEMANKFYPNPFIYQIGYPSDKTWWGSYADAPKTMGDALVAQTKAGQDIGIVWVDFSLKVLPYIDNGTSDTPKPTSTNTPKPTSTNTPKPTATNTPTPTLVNPTGSITYINVSGYVKPDFGYSDTSINAGFNVEVYAGLTKKGTTDNNGYFDIKSIPMSDIVGLLKISKDGYLDRSYANVTSDIQVGTFDQPILMWAGDVAKDNVINMADIMEIAKYFNTIAGDGKFNAICDFNKDNAVNMADIMIVTQHFNKTQADYPTPIVVKPTPSNSPTNTQKPTNTPTMIPTPTTSAGIGYKVIGYLADWGDWGTVDASKMTHINYAFAGISGGRVIGGNSTKLASLRSIKAQYPNVKTFISIGGWGADGFSDAALTDSSRNIFADSAITYMKNNGFDGIDLDWEYPCNNAAGIVARPEDKHNFTLMLQKLREKLDVQGSADGKHYLLSIASGADDSYVQNTELGTLHQYLDNINIMTYDMVGADWSTLTGHHTNLYASSSDPSGMSSDKAVQLHIAAGVPANKIVLGCAFYGRYFNNVNNTNNGLGQTFSGGGEMNYSVILNNVNKNGYTRYWDSNAKAPYLFNGNQFISYDDVESLGYKTSYIKTKGLGGAMFWEYTQDSTRALVNKIYGDLK